MPADTTQPFEPGGASTPAPSGEAIEITTRTKLPQEQQGPSTAETSFSTGFRAPLDRAVAFKEVEGEFPNADRMQLEARYRKSTGGAIIEVKYHTSDKWYPLYTKSRGYSEKTLNASLPKRVTEALGKSLTEEFSETNQELSRNQKELQAKEKRKEQLQQTSATTGKMRQELDSLRNRMKAVADQIQELEDQHGPLNTEEIQRLKNEKRSLESEHQAKRKQLSQTQKDAKQADKLQEDINKLTQRNRALDSSLNKLRAKIDARQTLDELKQNKEELEIKIEEDKRVIADENTFSSEREAAEGRIAEREEELARVNTEIEVRERRRPLRERVAEIFKKYGWTLQAVVLAAGITISAVVLATLRGLARATKAIGNGLKNIGKQAAGALPGLIGSIVGFIFKAAGQAISFLAEHAWLLILAVVAFLVERVTKRARA